MRKLTLLLVLSVGMVYYAHAQGQLTGDLMVNTNFYDRDTVIGANTSQYQHELSSSEAWLFLNYELNGFNFSTRFDLFHNSPLLDPNEVYTDQGLAFYSVSKSVGKLDITAGHFYDQFGSGILFRAFEDRNLGLDYAVQGLRIKYNFSENTMLKAFTGRQKNRFSLHPQVMKGANIEHVSIWGDQAIFVSGAAYLNRTIDQNTMNQLATAINSYKLADRFIPRYNVHAFSLYNTLSYKKISWYIEYAQKSKEAIKDKAGDQFIFRDGHVIYSVLNYSTKGFGASLQYKKSNTFSMRSSPFDELLIGTMNYMPPMSKQNAKTLLARYSISAQEFGEESAQLELTYSPNKHTSFGGNFSYVEDEENTKLFHEINLSAYHKWNKKFKTKFGAQNVYYNKLVYENHLDNYLDGSVEDAVVKTLTGFVELTYKIDRKRSLRSELQYLQTEQDHGDFFFGLLEYSMAPHWSFSVADMINTKPKKIATKEHYYNFTAVYTLNQTRFSIGYMKQVEGVVCTGGICRVEPAFSGVKFNLTTNF